MATRRPSKNSGRLILDNCYHGHGLCGARLQITATSCLHPYTTVTALLIRHFLKGFPCCPYLRRRVPLSLVRNCVCRNVAEYIKLPSLLAAGKFMASLCLGSGKYCFFQSNGLAKRDRERGRERGERGEREVEESLSLQKLEKLLTTKRVLPLYRGGRGERVIITEIQWISPRNCRSSFSVNRLLKSIVSYYSLLGKIYPARGKSDMDERPIRSLVNLFSRAIRHEM